MAATALGAMDSTRGKLRTRATSVASVCNRGEDRAVRVDGASPGSDRSFEAAVPAGEDPVRYAHLLGRIRDAALAGERSPAAARPLVGDSWRRARLGDLDRAVPNGTAPI